MIPGHETALGGPRPSVPTSSTSGSLVLISLHSWARQGNVSSVHNSSGAFCHLGPVQLKDGFDFWRLLTFIYIYISLKGYKLYGCRVELCILFWGNNWLAIWMWRVTSAWLSTDRVLSCRPQVPQILCVFLHRLGKPTVQAVGTETASEPFLTATDCTAAAIQDLFIRAAEQKLEHRAFSPGQTADWSWSWSHSRHPQTASEQDPCSLCD